MAEGRAGHEPTELSGPDINLPRRWYRKPQWQISTVAVVAILVAGLLWWCPWCPVRVTDGSELLAANLEQVQELIRAENDKVTKSGEEWVSIAVMQPIRPAPGERNTPPRVAHTLQGAYLAQYWLNHPNGQDDFGDDRPLIKLLIADTGENGEDWKPTVTRLADLASPDNEEHLVAVVGISRSTIHTQAAVTELASHGIPMVGSTITATNLSAAGLFRVGSTNSDEAIAMINYLRGTPEWQSATPAKPFKAFLLQDRASADTYAADFGDKYRDAFPRNDTAHFLYNAEASFDGDKPGVGNVLRSHIPTICDIDPNVVFFAGRSEDLRTFLGHLAKRQCSDTPITVAAGDDISDLNYPIPTEPRWAADANIAVYYTALASPQAWPDAAYDKYISSETENRFKAVPGCPKGCPKSYASLFDPNTLEDEYAIMAHDSVLTAVTAARGRSQTEPRPTAEALFNGLYQIHVGQKVPGASGWIYFQREPGRPEGVPYNKAVPIMRLSPDGLAELVTLSAPLGTPPTGEDQLR